MEITSQIILYKDLNEGIVFERDDYGIAAKCNQPLIQSFLNNPNLQEYDAPFMYLGRVDGIIGGIAMWFPTRMKVGEEIVPAECSSTLEVYEDYRKLAIGTDIVMYPIVSDRFHYLIYAGISEQALKIYKKIGFKIFEYPRSMRIQNARCLLESKGLSGGLLKISSYICNGFLKSWYAISSIGTHYHEYRIEKMNDAPEWVNDMVLNEGHKYMEVHDQQWIQWVLKNNLHAEKNDIQSFYGVYKNEKPVAFFMTKERFRDEAGGTLRNVIIGSIMEWGVAQGTALTEVDLYQMAVKTFTSEVDILEFATTDNDVLYKMKKHGFIPHGYAHIAVNDLMGKYKDSKDMSQWRIRFGYSDVFLT